MNSIESMKVIFCIDVSPSMGYKINDQQKSFLEKLNEAYNDGFLKVVTACQRKDVQVCFITYGSTAYAAQSTFRIIPRGMTEDEMQEYHLALQAEKTGKTNQASAFEKVLECNRDSHMNGAVVIVVTDGDPDETCPDAQCKDLRSLIVEHMQVYRYMVDGGEQTIRYSENNVDIHLPFRDDVFTKLFCDIIPSQLGISGRIVID